MKGQDAERLAGLLAQCQALAYLDLSWNDICNAGAESFEGVLAHCTALAHLNLSGNVYGGNLVGQARAESLAGVLGQCPAVAHLDLRSNDIKAGGRLRASWRGQASGLRLQAPCTACSLPSD